MCSPLLLQPCTQVSVYIILAALLTCINPIQAHYCICFMGKHSVDEWQIHIYTAPKPMPSAARCQGRKNTHDLWVGRLISSISLVNRYNISQSWESKSLNGRTCSGRVDLVGGWKLLGEKWHIKFRLVTTTDL